MKFIKLNSRCQRAVGEKGVFYIEKTKNYYYGSYIGKTIAFHFPRQSSFREMKEMMQKNEYWEEKK